jgi:hypothetical protein
VDEHERRAGDAGRLANADGSADGSREERLSNAELTRQDDEIAGRERAAEGPA